MTATIATYVEQDVTIRQGYGKTIAQESLDLSFFNAFMGLSNRALIRVDLLPQREQAGGTVRLYLKDKLTGKGGGREDRFKDNKDQRAILYQDIDVELFKNALESDPMPNVKRAAVDQTRDSFISDLGEWGAAKYDKTIMASYTRDLTNIFACKADGSAYPKNTTTDTIVPGDHLEASHIKLLVARAKSGKDGAGNPSPKIKPFMVKKKNDYGVTIMVQFFVLIVGPTQAASLKNDPVWIEAQKLAKARGDDNPIFTGQIGAMDGCLVIDREHFDFRDSGIITSHSTDVSEFLGGFDLHTYDGIGGKETEIGLFLGAQSGLIVDEGNYNYREGDTDLGDRLMVGVSKEVGFGKARWKIDENTQAADKRVKEMFHDKDFATIGLITAID